jgi:cytochrome c-type biogenesis protein
MFDPIEQGLRAVSSVSAWAYPLVFFAGAVTSLGPCVAPRFIAVVGLTSSREPRRAATMAASFVAGLVAVYACFGAGASLIGHLAQISSWVYGVVAVALGIAGITTLWKEERIPHGHTRYAVGEGGSFFLGASFALVISPCCTPLVVGILAYASAAGSPFYGTSLLACFALGHALPILGAALGARGVTGIFQRLAVRQAAEVLSAAMMLVLAAYYAVLA